MKNKFRYTLIVLFSILIIIELFIFDFDAKFGWKSLIHIFTPLLMIVAMMLSIKHVKKHGEN
ncbi:hypothetical protein [Algibacter sp.]|uniref:hypothetical protein n=1 Tax=Algibacter sp. TaxID=1872428 RepID=UPI003C7357DE